jgi:hypothetical protein
MVLFCLFDRTFPQKAEHPHFGMTGVQRAGQGWFDQRSLHCSEHSLNPLKSSNC